MCNAPEGPFWNVPFWICKPLELEGKCSLFGTVVLNELFCELLSCGCNGGNWLDGICGLPLGPPTIVGGNGLDFRFAVDNSSVGASPRGTFWNGWLEGGFNEGDDLLVWKLGGAPNCEGRYCGFILKWINRIWNS